jgi:hypothetical protein
MLFLQYLEEGRHEEALAAWSNATRLQTTHINAWTNAIILLSNMGEQTLCKFYCYTLVNRMIRYVNEILHSTP